MLTKQEVVKGLQEIKDILLVGITKREETLSAAITYLQQPPIGREELREGIVEILNTYENKMRDILVVGRFNFGAATETYRMQALDQILALLPQQEMISDKLKLNYSRLLEICKGAISDAIYCEDGLDGAIGQDIIKSIEELLKNNPTTCLECDHLTQENLKLGEKLKALSPHIPAGKEEIISDKTPSADEFECHKPLPEKTKEEKVITFDKSALPELCKIMGVPYDKDIIAFTKKGAVKNWLDLIEEPEKTYCECNPPRPNMYDEKRCNCGKEIKQPEKTCLNCANEDMPCAEGEINCSGYQPKPQEVKVIEPIEPCYGSNLQYIKDIHLKLDKIINHLTQDKK